MSTNQSIRTKGFIFIRQRGAVTPAQIAKELDVGVDEVMAEVIRPFFNAGRIKPTGADAGRWVYWYDAQTYEPELEAEGKKLVCPSRSTLQKYARRLFPECWPEKPERVKPPTLRELRMKKLYKYLKKYPGKSTVWWMSKTGKRRDVILRLLHHLEKEGLAYAEQQSSGGRGRPTLVWYPDPPGT